MSSSGGNRLPGVSSGGSGNITLVNGATSSRYDATGLGGAEIRMQDSNAGVDAKRSRIINTSGVTSFQSVNDAFNAAATIISFTNTGGAEPALGFFAAAPVAQPAAPVAPAATASTNAGPFGYTTAAQADAVVTALRAVLTLLHNLGLTA